LKSYKNNFKKNSEIFKRLNPENKVKKLKRQLRLRLKRV